MLLCPVTFRNQHPQLQKTTPSHCFPKSGSAIPRVFSAVGVSRYSMERAGVYSRLRQQPAETERLVFPSRSDRIVSTDSSSEEPIFPCKAPQIGESSGRRFNREMSDPASMIKMRPLRILKFGGTSVGDTSSIRRVAEIVRDAADESDLVVVVSAMSGVTNSLLEAAARAEAGDLSAAQAIFAALRAQHESVLNSLVQYPEERTAIHGKMQDCYEQGEQLCKRAEALRELSLRDRDLISSLGERLCAPLVAAALMASGVRSEAIEATEIVITDSCHGAANPCMDATRERCTGRVDELLERGAVPVITGFIGATPDGVLTTLAAADRIIQRPSWVRHWVPTRSSSGPMWMA